MDPNFPTIPTPPRNTALWPAADFPIARAKEGLMASPKVRRAVAGVLAAAETFKAVSDGCLAEFETERDELRVTEADRKAKLDRVVKLCLASKNPITQSFGDEIAKTGNVDARFDAKNFSDTALAYLSGSMAWNTETIRALVAAGADVNAKCDGGSPLEYAFKCENYRIAGFLIANGADLNLERHKGGRILNLTLQGRLAENSEAVRAILRAGVDPNMLNTANRKMIRVSCRSGHYDILANIFVLASKSGYVETVKLFLEHPDFDLALCSQWNVSYAMAKRVGNENYPKIRSLIAEKMAEKSTGRFSRLKWQAISRFRKFFRIGY